MDLIKVGSPGLHLISCGMSLDLNLFILKIGVIRATHRIALELNTI